MIKKITQKLNDQNFVDAFVTNPDDTVQKEFGVSLEMVMKEISGTGEEYENFMNKLASVMDCEFLTAAASSCCT